MKPSITTITPVIPETYYYQPIPFFDGKILKCRGIVTIENRAWVPDRVPNTIELEGYRGDRIHAETFEPYNPYGI